MDLYTVNSIECLKIAVTTQQLILHRVEKWMCKVDLWIILICWKKTATEKNLLFHAKLSLIIFLPVPWFSKPNQFRSFSLFEKCFTLISMVLLMRMPLFAGKVIGHAWYTQYFRCSESRFIFIALDKDPLHHKYLVRTSGMLLNIWTDRNKCRIMRA